MTCAPQTRLVRRDLTHRVRFKEPISSHRIVCVIAQNNNVTCDNVVKNRSNRNKRGCDKRATQRW